MTFLQNLPALKNDISGLFIGTTDYLREEFCCEPDQVRQQQALQKGEFACSVCLWPSCDLKDENVTKYREVVEAENFAQVVVILSSRYNFERFWTVSARDRSGKTFNYSFTAERTGQELRKEEAQFLKCHGVTVDELAVF